MKSLVDTLVQYAEYHRDRRNIATHYVGIPMIVVGTEAFLARIGIGPVNLAVAATAAASAYYRKLDPDYGYGNVMAALLSGACGIGNIIAAMPLPVWAATSASLFVGGWALQFLGHKFEGRKPAFLDDLVGLLVGPLFIVCEASFALGFAPELKEEIERRAGATRSGKLASNGLAVAHPAAS